MSAVREHSITNITGLREDDVNDRSYDYYKIVLLT